VGGEVRVIGSPPVHFLHCGMIANREIKNHRSETARRRSRDLRAIVIYAAFCGFSVCFLAGQQAFGQIPTSDIVGTVSDATGAVVMNAQGAVTITATGDTRKQLSGSDGGFVFNPLLPGPYTVTVEAPSFSRMLSNVTVVAGDRARVDPQLLDCRGGP
jgi:Carboxypeptidase regulatory-like domain